MHPDPHHESRRHESLRRPTWHPPEAWDHSLSEERTPRPPPERRFGGLEPDTWVVVGLGAFALVGLMCATVAVLFVALW